MKRILKIVSLILLTFNLVTGQERNGFTLHGNIQGLKDRSEVYLVTANLDTVGTGISRGSDFKIEGVVIGDANYYFLRLDSNVKKDVSMALWLTNSDITVKGKIEEWPNVSLQGSEPHDEYISVLKLHKEYGNNPTQMNNAFKQFIKNKPNSIYVADLILKMLPVLQYDGLLESYSSLTERAKSCFWGQKLAKELERIKMGKMLKEAIPGFMINFHITDLEGNKRSIYDLTSKSEYTLIDFWASWCVPCRNAIPSVKKVYDDFHKKGFNVIGVSIDKDLDQWKRAVREDQVPWDQGLDNVEMVNKYFYDFSMIPAYILINKTGEIVQTEYISNAKRGQFKTFKDKSLSNNLYEIVERLLSERYKSSRP